MRVTPHGSRISALCWTRRSLEDRGRLYVDLKRGSERIREVRTFGTTTAQLHALRAWLRETRVTQVAMESTGSYWKPVFNLLEEDGTPWWLGDRIMASGLVRAAA